MTTLRKARESGELDQFAKEHERDAPGDEDAFNRALKSMAQTSPDISWARRASK